jgi:hypothetical protein
MGAHLICILGLLLDAALKLLGKGGMVQVLLAQHHYHHIMSHCNKLTVTHFSCLLSMYASLMTYLREVMLLMLPLGHNILTKYHYKIEKRVLVPDALSFQMQKMWVYSFDHI